MLDEWTSARLAKEQCWCLFLRKEAIQAGVGGGGRAEVKGCREYKMLLKEIEIRAIR